ncbi:MAG: DUF86 domain-containing protein [Chloroflexota bacterium]|nr:DUF86 domain-containing protein [Chloroflexota bacterium]
MLLEDIQQSIHYIIEDTGGMTRDEFVRNRFVHQAVERNFEIIGEAVNRLRRADPAVVDWISGYEQIIGLRNTLLHGYDIINYSTLWHAVTVSMPVLENEVNGLLENSP